MYLTSIPNRNSPPAILLRESYREDGKVKTHTLANVTNWNPAVVEAMRSALKGEFLLNESALIAKASSLSGFHDKKYRKQPTNYSCGAV